MLIRVRIERRLAGSATVDPRPALQRLSPEGELVTFVRLVRHGEIFCLAREPLGRTLEERRDDAIRVHRPLCVRLPTGEHWYTSPVLAIDSDSRGRPDEVLTRSGSLYRIVWL